jgi:hypothetical protein
MKFKNLIGVVQFGTMLRVTEEDTKKKHYDEKWLWGYSASQFLESVQNADVSLVTVNGDTLEIGIITEKAKP